MVIVKNKIIFLPGNKIIIFFHFSVNPVSYTHLDVYKRQHINSIHSKIQFTMEMKADNSIPFLAHFIKRKDNHLSFSRFRKPTHT